MGMDSVSSKIYSCYEFFVEWEGDPRVKHFPLMGSPLPILTILVVYLLFVFKIGPKIMKDREPYTLKKTMMAYNLLHIVLNSISVFMGVRYLSETSIFCTPVGNENVILCHYLYLVLKIVDLFDTVFFVLRKNYRQITFLHIYHHTIMASLTWLTLKYVPGGQVYFIGSINGFVHIVMYFYYFLTTWKPQYKKNIWWKRHITELQLVQHCIVFLSFLLPLLNPECTYPKLVLAGFLPPNVLMIYLFVKFYVNTYFKETPLKKLKD